MKSNLEPSAQEVLAGLVERVTPKELILTALELERSEGVVIADKVGDTACTFLAGLYRAEQAIADRLICIVSGRLPWPWIDEEKAVPWIEKRSGLQLADSQRAAIRLALMAKARERFLAIEVCREEQRAASLLDNPLPRSAPTQWREFGSRGRPPKLRHPQLFRSGPARPERRKKLIRSEDPLRLLRRF